MSTIARTAGSDRPDGTDTAYNIIGRAGNDATSGGDSNDSLTGGAGNDHIQGDGRNDLGISDRIDVSRFSAAHDDPLSAPRAEVHLQRTVATLRPCDLTSSAPATSRGHALDRCSAHWNSGRRWNSGSKMSRRFLLGLLILLNLACWIGIFLAAWPTKDPTSPPAARVGR
jgi:hypothetical protein